MYCILFGLLLFTHFYSVVYKEATQIPEYKLFQKTAKMCRFFANTLIHYIKVMKQLSPYRTVRFILVDMIEQTPEHTI